MDGFSRKLARHGARRFASELAPTKDLVPSADEYPLMAHFGTQFVK